MHHNVNDSETLLKAVEVLKNGGVVMHPTETCYGLAVDILNESALKKMYNIKGRDFNKPVSILVDGFGMAEEYGIFSDKALQLAHKFWPGPLSIVVPRKRSLPNFLNPGEDFVSIRWSGNSFCEDLVFRFGGPITTTSANVAGEDPLYEAIKFSDGIDLVVDGGVLSQNQPSTIVKVDGDRVEVLRQGGLLIEEAC
ncbi:threonylcarbamoyl-AMP synthase [Candidatus Peregrinibacteria bacterium CG10_big_fil_rev_8_21_14_0_10_36_19]|nr:MAG: threonylcarbamoyl-AMP synthase [Candidatus Peregrinibacteria bacterium CG10_big_fil_rev_8_21_14_0_10_36_19]